MTDKPSLKQLDQRARLLGGRLAFAWLCFRWARRLAWLTIAAFLLWGTLLSWPSWQTDLILHRQLTAGGWWLVFLLACSSIPFTLASGSVLTVSGLLASRTWWVMLILALFLAVTGWWAGGDRGLLFGMSGWIGLALVLGWALKPLLNQRSEEM